MGGSFAPAEEREWTPPPSCLLRWCRVGLPSLQSGRGVDICPLYAWLWGDPPVKEWQLLRTPPSAEFLFFCFLVFIKENMNGNVVNQIMMHGIHHAQLCTCTLNCILFKLNSKIKLSAAIHH